MGTPLGLRHNFKAHSAYTVEQLRDPIDAALGTTSSSGLALQRAAGRVAALFPAFGPYDFCYRVGL